MFGWIKPGTFGLCWICFVGMALIAHADQHVSVRGLQALLFNSKTGTFSPDVLAQSGSALGNVPSGAFASVSTFIIVKVQIAREAPLPTNLRVRLAVTESGAMPFATPRQHRPDRVILDAKARLGPVDEDGIAYVGFWLPNTGCRSLTLTASLVGSKVGPPITEILPFACYE